MLSTLDFLTTLLSSVLTDSIKERLKRRGSPEIAKRRVLRLYKALGKVNDNINCFVTTLERFSQWIQEENPEREMKKEPLSLSDRFIRWVQGRPSTSSPIEGFKESAQKLLNSLKDLSDALDKLNPQLEIHQPKLWEHIVSLTEDDSLIIDRTRRFIPISYWRRADSEGHISDRDKKMLAEIVDRAAFNRKLLSKLIEDYRGFIANEFTFKESF